MKTNLDFDSQGQLPKYLKLFNAIVQDIERGYLVVGDQLPSLNEACAEWGLCKDSVKLAYATLHQRGFVTSITRKGFFVAGSPKRHALRVLIVAGQLTDGVKELHDAILSSMNQEIILDVCSYNYQRQLLYPLLEKHVGDYHYFIMMPHLVGQDQATIQCLRKIPSSNLILIGNDWAESLQHGHRLHYGGEEAVYEALVTQLDILRKYHRLNLVFSGQDCFDTDSIRAFRRFCTTHAFDFQLIDELVATDVQAGHAYFVAHSHHLVALALHCQSLGWELGQQVGVISLVENDNTRLLAGSVAVIGCLSADIGRRVALIMGDHQKRNVAPSRTSLLHQQRYHVHR
ncbi:MAG: winged helix-turn-helix domain-containing protein [Dyadobacter sp.]|uniref:winged helix-turn-helix domain-containing protein n=1 Tax=Dyadobacter sp. TaxID=1914288 RepID=UPI003264E9D7